jgi:hypothetical protein
LWIAAMIVDPIVADGALVLVPEIRGQAPALSFGMRIGQRIKPGA